MTKMDVEWAAAELDAFLSVTSQVVPRSTGGVAYFGTVMSGSQSEADQRSHVVEQILDRATPGWASDRPEADKKYTWLRAKVARGKAALERAEEIAEKLGDSAPELDAGKLHAWAWENGASYWRTGHYHQAVMQAAIRVNSETQAKVGRRDVSETALFNEAFSLDDPKPDRSRLRLTKDDGGDTYRNLHRGARSFAEGLYAAIRNPGMHQAHDVDDEHLALEQLAAFSILARWVDEAAVLTA
ncbi:DNA restriction-modification system protein [Curtobacterium flaccumfaciens UCD-AKU]|uniref:TIGR02391 family protein n=1 Tax=Curtobacterium flaccumfaciens TaxID=2035 RepID=UPI00036D3044|nr:TIGR02391 family protein [Curtobacterium flaccumfaciens]EYT65528.1 DNA restriction-modification system protein [Curtobacterium flaccumfaciens UCD-AKU]